MHELAESADLAGMDASTTELIPHPAGEQFQVEERFATADTFGGTVEWDPTVPVTPLGQLPFFIDYLKQGSLFDAWVADCPPVLSSPNAPRKRDLLGTLLLSTLAGHYRYAHVTSLRNLQPHETDTTGMAQWIDVSACKPLESALAVAAPGAGVVSALCGPGRCGIRRGVIAAGSGGSADISFASGFRHRCLLISSCPICLHPVEYRPLNGRLGLWCPSCEKCVDIALPPRRIPFWPYGTPQQYGRCVAIRVSDEARPLLLRIQSDLLTALGGAWPGAAWARGLRRAGLFSVLRALSFVMLGPLWENAYRLPQSRYWVEPCWSLPDDWTPGSLPPETAAPTLLSSVTFLAAENRTRLQGITWNPRFLLAGRRTH